MLMSPGILHLIEHPLASKHLAELTLSATVSPVCLLVHNRLTTQIAAATYNLVGFDVVS